MSDDNVADCLSRAIADFRDEFLLRIDHALTRLREREQHESLAVSQAVAANVARSAPPREPPVFSPSSRGGAGPKGPDLEPMARRESRPDTEAFAPRAPLADLPRSPVVKSGAEADVNAPSTPLDSLGRLDALARLLDKRLMASRDEPAANSGANAEAGRSHAPGDDRPGGGTP